MLTHLLDTSAWIAHIRREPGWATISDLLKSEETRVGISALSLVELHARLRSFGRETEFRQVVEDYRGLFFQIIPFDESIALQTVALRQSAGARVPAIDAMIAASAAHHDAILVHRDAHFTKLSVDQVRQYYLAGSDTIK